MRNYYKIDALSNSSLSVLDRSPTEFYRRFILKDLPQEETDAMRLGSAVHMLALEPERFHERYTVLDGPINPSTGKCYGRDTKKFEAWLEDAKQSASGELIIREEFSESIAIAQAFQGHPEILAIMASKAEKFYEREFYFEAITTDGRKEPAKAMMDCVIPDLGLIIDLKTTQDPSPNKWCWSALDYGYHRQAAIYLDVAEYTFNKAFRFLFGVVRSRAPYESAVYELDQRSIERGREECQALIDEAVDRKATNNWLADWQTGIQTMALPERKRR